MANLISGETLRILLVSAREGIRDEVGEALSGRAGDHRLYWVSQPDLAVVRGQDLVPHVVLLDDDLAGANPVSLIGQLSQRLPAAAIIALVPGDNIGLARQAVLAGARGFVTKPLQAEDLLAALRQVLGQRQVTGVPAAEETVASGRVVVFCAPKGGTGRTTLAINTAVTLRQVTDEPVALVDADYAAPALDVALNMPGQNTIAELLPRLAQLDRDLVTFALPLHASRVRVLLAPPPGDLSNPISLPHVQQVVVWLKRMFAWVIVDLGLPLDETAFGFLDGADRIVMSVLPEMVGLRNTRLMLDQLHTRGYPPNKIWLVLNRASMQGGVSAADIEERLRVKISYRVPDDQPLATYSINRGIPIVTSHKNSAVARSVRVLARGLVQDQRDEEPALGEAPAAAGGLLGRLFGRSRPAGA